MPFPSLILRARARVPTSGLPNLLEEVARRDIIERNQNKRSGDGTDRLVEGGNGLAVEREGTLREDRIGGQRIIETENILGQTREEERRAKVGMTEKGKEIGVGKREDKMAGMVLEI